MAKNLACDGPSAREYNPVEGRDALEEAFQNEENCFGSHPNIKKQIKLDQLAFFINGLINNFTYVVFLSAAEDIVGESVPKAAVLIADIIPSVCIKLIVPYYMHSISYSSRIVVIILSAIMSLFVVAFGGGLSVQLLGIVIASAGSGLGEITFLALASFYPHNVISPWSSGTGGAGVAGSLAYLALSTWFGLKPSSSLLICAVAPLFMFISYFKLMSHPQLAIESDRLRTAPMSLEDPAFDELRPENLPLVERFKIVRGMISEYMLPLLFVFWAEYTINQGVAPVLLFPLEDTPFKALRDHYVYYQFIYQLGVFVSRSSSAIFPIDKLWYLVLAQFGTLAIFLSQALLVFNSTIYLTLLLVFWEGLFGGAIYANAFRRLKSEMPRHQSEFAMGAASVADSFGIALASITAYVLEPVLCNYQIYNGIYLCKKASGL